MEVDEIERQVSKFQRIGSNGDNSSNSHKIATLEREFGYPETRTTGFPTRMAAVEELSGGLVDGRRLGIVRVSRASGGKDRHSKVLTSKGLRDRRVRLSVTTAIQFYDLQDRLGYDQPSKAVEWLIKAASSSIAELPSLDPSFTDGHHQQQQQQQHQHHTNQLQKQQSDEKKSNEIEDPRYQNNQQQINNNDNNNVSFSKSSACSSTSETSKGSGLSLSRSENRIKARERAREMAAKKEKEKETDPVRVNGISHNSSFTDLLNGGVNSNTSNPSTTPESRMQWATPMLDYFFNRPPQSSSSPHLIQMPQFNIDNHPQQHHFTFLQENFAPVVTASGDGGGESYNLNFSIASSSSGGVIAPGFNRGTLQSNLLSILPHHHHLQRFPSPSMVDASTSTNFPIFIAPSIGSGPPDHFPSTGYDSQRLQLYGGNDGGARHSDHHKDKSKN